MGGTICLCTECKRQEEAALVYKTGVSRIHDDSLLKSLIPSSEAGLEGNVILGKCFLMQTWESGGSSICRSMYAG